MIHRTPDTFNKGKKTPADSRDWLVADGSKEVSSPKQIWGRGDLVVTNSQKEQDVALLAAPAESSGKCGHIYLFGAMRVVTADGVDCTPSGTFRKALLALILLGPRASRSRTAIQNMLWPGKHSSNLRTALSVLRRELKPLGDDLFSVTSQSVSIDRDRLWVDVLDDPAGCLKEGALGNTELVEGLDLQGADLEDFEDWLRIERTSIEEKLSAFGGAPLALPVQGLSRADIILNQAIPTRNNHLVPDFGLMPVYSEGLSPLHTRMADSILDALGSSLKELNQCDIYDFRPENQRGFKSPDGAGPDFLLGLSVVQQGTHLGLSLAVRDAGTEALVWDQTMSAEASGIHGLDSLAVSGFVDQCSDRLARLSEEASFSDGVKAGTPYQALNLMFRLDRDSVDQAGLLLDKSMSDDDNIVFSSLSSYLDTIRVGENLTDGEPEDDQIERVLSMVGRLSKDPSNALAMTTAGYALDFLTGDRVQAEKLMVEAIRINPTQAFSWDHLAMFHMRTGQYDKAFNCARRALHLGAHSPLRYCYETSLCMIATVRGDFQSAAYFGRRALAKSPDFFSALQFTATSLAFLGRHSEAVVCLDRMKKLQPDLSFESFADRALVRCDAPTCERILDGLKRAGLN
jgi:tetratricopeptide (TPR) repeat protein